MSNNKTKKIIRYTFLLGLFLLVLGTSYALFTITLTGNKLTRIKTAKVSLQLLDENNNSIEKTNNNSYEYEININNALPTSDEEGLEQEGFKFKLKNNGNIPVKYTIYLDDLPIENGEERINDQYIKYSLEKNGTTEYFQLLRYTGVDPNRKLDLGVIGPNEVNEYELKIWIAEKATIEAANKVFSTALRVDGVQYTNTMNIKDSTFADTLSKQGIVATIDKVSNADVVLSGLYKYVDEDGTITYVYRGYNPNNYVSFAGSIWHVLRIQEDGTVKLMKRDALNFASTLATYQDSIANEGDSVKTVLYSSSGIDYSTSNVKTYIDEWYQTEMSAYDDKIAYNDYCNDKTENKNSQYYFNSRGNAKSYGLFNRFSILETKILNDDEEWVDKTFEVYSADFVRPSITCREEDKVRTKAAMITADEKALVDFFSDSSYLPYDSYWTMSPMTDQVIYYESMLGIMMAFDRSAYCKVRPVITLKSNVTVSSGNGTSNNPYVIQ